MNPLSNLQLDCPPPPSPLLVWPRDSGPLLDSARSRSGPQPCLLLPSPAPVRRPCFPSISAPSAPSPISAQSPAFPFQSLLQVPSPSAWNWGRVPLAPPSPFPQAEISIGPASDSRVRLWPDTRPPHPYPPTTGLRARHQTHSPATLGVGMIWGAVGCEVGGHSCSRLGPRAQPREILRATASAERATSLLPARGRGAQTERCRPPARLASCLPGPWASSGAPCPHPETHRPLSRGQPRVSATQAFVRCLRD